MNGVFYSSGRIVKLLKYEKSGFIDDLFGNEIYFNSDSLISKERKLKEGMSVIFRMSEKFDMKRQQNCPVAVDIEIIEG